VLQVPQALQVPQEQQAQLAQQALLVKREQLAKQGQQVLQGLLAQRARLVIVTNPQVAQLQFHQRKVVL
jgi:hypothetical protein